MSQRKIGIFSGTFDPVHQGHIGLAVEATKKANLDVLYFLVEAAPRRKSGITHYAHRIAMLKLAIKSHPKLQILELPDRQFSVAKTLPRLRQHFGDSELFFVAGSDMLAHMPQWPLIESMLEQMSLIVAPRSNTPHVDIEQLLASLPQDSKVIIINSPSPNISSGQLRQTLMAGKSAKVLPIIEPYIKEHWLYSGVVPNNS